MSEEFGDDEFDAITPAWIWDNVSIFGYCITWEACACGYTGICYWPKGKQGGVLTTCLDCEDQNYTMAVIACLN